MSIDKIHKVFVSNWVILFIAIIAFTVFRLHGDPTNHHLWYTTVVQVGIALFLVLLNNIIGVIRPQTLLPALIYLLFLINTPLFHYELRGSLVAVCILLSYMFLFYTSENSKPEVYALNISLVLTLGSLLWTPLLFFFPIFWYGFYRLNKFNMRVIPASIIGFLTVYFVIFAWSVFRDDLGILLNFIPSGEKLFLIQKPELTFYEWILFGFTLMLYFRAGYKLFVSGISTTIRKVSILNFLYFSSFVIIFLLLAQTPFKAYWALIIYIPVSLMLAYLFSQPNNKSEKYLMFLFFVFIATIGILQSLSS
jgi:hypothetical protein